MSDSDVETPPGLLWTGEEFIKIKHWIEVEGS